VTPKTARRLTWAAVYLTAATVPLSAYLLSRPLATPLTPEAVLSVGVAFVGALASAVVGALIVSQHPRHPVGWMFSLSGLANAGAIVLAAYGELAIVPSASLPAGTLAKDISHVLLQSGLFLPLTLGLLLFPDGRLQSRWWWPAAAAALLGLVMRLVADALDTRQSLTEWTGDIGVLLTIASALAGLVSLALRWRRAGPEVRQQLKWMAAAAGLVVIAFIGDTAFNIVRPNVISNDAEFLIFSLTYITVPIAAGTAILRYRLYEIDFIINRAIVYIVLTAILAGLYAALTGTLQRIFVSVTGQSSDAAIIITVALIATLFTPVRNALQRLVDSRFKEARDLERLMQSLETQVGAVIDVMDGQRLAERLVRTAREGADATGAALFLDGDSDGQPTYVSGTWTDDAVLVVPLRAGDQEVGRIALGPRRHGAPYVERERERLQQAADVVAVGLTLGRRPSHVEVVAQAEREQGVPLS